MTDIELAIDNSGLTRSSQVNHDDDERTDEKDVAGDDRRCCGRTFKYESSS
jgi:hypothetical protein